MKHVEPTFYSQKGCTDELVSFNTIDGIQSRWKWDAVSL
jgi:hypothetical protein